MQTLMQLWNMNIYIGLRIQIGKWRLIKSPDVYLQEFTFKVTRDDLTRKTLEVTVWDKDFGRNDYIGMCGTRLLSLVSVFSHVTLGGFVTKIMNS